MFPFLSTQTNRKDKVIARAGICLFALLFFLCSILSALPSFDSVGELLARYGLAGYAEANSDDSNHHAKALEQYTDRPFSQGTSRSDEPPSAQTPAEPSVTAPSADDGALKFDFSAL